MKKQITPFKSEWANYMVRPFIEQEQLNKAVNTIICDVKRNGDKALVRYARLFDKVELSNICVSETEIQNSENLISDALKSSIKLAYNNIWKFHSAQARNEEIIETSPGVQCWRKSVPIEKVGLYIPGGTAPLFSSVLMLGIPAKIAGCREIVLCTPPNVEKRINPGILYAAKLVGINRIYRIGGAQAIAAMTFGTESVDPVYKILGPGNQYVTKAKELVQQFGVAIDMPAGPSEVLIIADDTSIPEFVAADLLSQAEHGEDSQVILLSNSESMIDKCIAELDNQIERLPRKEVAKKALENSNCICLNSIDECIEFSNQYAPEHLIISGSNAENYIDKIECAGSVFVGNYSCESAGDYASGTNHTLPTNGFAKNYSGVSLETYQKTISFQKLTKEGINSIGEAIEIMAEAEDLQAHKNAVTYRLMYNEN